MTACVVFLLVVLPPLVADLGCGRSNSNSITLKLPPPPPETDLLMVELVPSAAKDSLPYAVQTASPSSRVCVVEDLLPATQYYFRLKTHPSTAPSIVWGWRNHSGAVGCTTAATKVGERAHSLGRLGLPEPTAVGVVWQWGQRTASTPHPTATVQLIDEVGGDSNHPSIPMDVTPFSTSNTTTPATSQGRIEGLVPGSVYKIAVEGSDPVQFRTSGGGTQFTAMYRVSE
jgi:hypothetical protein